MRERNRLKQGISMRDQVTVFFGVGKKGRGVRVIGESANITLRSLNNPKI